MATNWDRIVGRLVIVGAAIVVVGIVVGYVLPHNFGADVSISKFLVEHRAGWLTRLVRAVTATGASGFLIPFGIIAAVVLVARQRSARPAVVIAVASLGAALMYNVIKTTVARSGPAIAPIIETEHGYSFPSGHAAQSIALYGAVASEAMVGVARRWRVRAFVVVLVWAALIGFSRVYLGVHWTSDVVAGWTLGAFWLSTVQSTLARPRAFLALRR